MSNKDGAIISIDGNDYIIIEGLEIYDFSSAVAYGILLDSDESHIIIRNNKIHDICTTMPSENGEANAILCYGESDGGWNGEFTEEYVRNKPDLSDCSQVN